MPHSENEFEPTDTGLRGLPLLRKIMEIIKSEEHRKNWNQKQWGEARLPGGSMDHSEFYMSFNPNQPPVECGTAYCVAGWAAHLTGAKMNWHPATAYDDETDTHRIIGYRAESVVGDDEQTINSYAREVLEVGEYTSSRLFDAYNTIEDLEGIVDDIEWNDTYS